MKQIDDELKEIKVWEDQLPELEELLEIMKWKGLNHKDIDDLDDLIQMIKGARSTYLLKRAPSLFKEKQVITFNDWCQKVKKRPDQTKTDHCPSCGVLLREMQSNENISIVCPKCYMVYDYPEESQSLGMGSINRPEYTRYQHFDYWLDRLQARESAKIPDELIEYLKSRHQKMRNQKLTAQCVRKYLKGAPKQYHGSRYYNHINYIISKITGHPPIILSHDLEQQLKDMFNSIQDPFEKIKELYGRRNLLSYMYIINRLCDILARKGNEEAKNLLPNLVVTFKPDKVNELDHIWKLVCDMSDLPYFTSHPRHKPLGLRQLYLKKTRA